MPVPHLHILHPPENSLPGITEWLSEVEVLLRGDANWDACQFRRVQYDAQAGFAVGTEIDLIRRNPGPVILIQKVRALLRNQLEQAVRRISVIHCVPVVCAEDLWQVIETARQQHEDGEPRIPLRELIAYLVVRKLERYGKWGGTSLNKNFMWTEDLPKGGFPKGITEPREILDVAEQLVRLGVLTYKTSDGKRKYALGGKPMVQPILDSKSFDRHPRNHELRKFFEKRPERVTVRLLDYNDD